jgi:PAS domain S-box-containing protein
LHRWYDLFAYRPATKQFAVVVTDVTEKREAEQALHESRQRFQRFFELGTFGMFITSPTKGWIEINDSLCEILGYSSDELHRMKWVDLTHPDDLAADEQKFDQVIAGEIEGYSLEKRFLRKDGQPIIAILSVRCLRDSERNVQYFVGIIRDITARRRAEEELKASLREKEVLLREIHHRVKNNLQVVSSLLNLQAGYIDNEASKMAFRESHQRVRAMALVHERLYRSENLARINFGEYLDTVTTEIARLHARGPVRTSTSVAAIDLEINQAIPCGLIVNELVTNAFKHAFPSGRGGTVHVSFRRVDMKSVELKVEDDGIGFPVDHDVRGRTSMGMMLVTSLAEQIGGTLGIKSRQGACFTLTFPG